MAAKARIAVIGAGLMGHGIAQVFALAGHEVTITDSDKPNLDTVKQRIAPTCATSVTTRRPSSACGRPSTSRLRARCGFRGRGGA